MFFREKKRDTILNTQISYVNVAAEYAEEFKDEMDYKPLDRARLDRLAREVGDLGTICDIGCGLGQIARYIYCRGVKTIGVILSPRMVEEAQRLNPKIHFHQGVCVWEEAKDLLRTLRGMAEQKRDCDHQRV